VRSPRGSTRLGRAGAATRTETATPGQETRCTARPGRRHGASTADDPESSQLGTPCLTLPPRAAMPEGPSESGRSASGPTGAGADAFGAATAALAAAIEHAAPRRRRCTAATARRRCGGAAAVPLFTLPPPTCPCCLLHTSRCRCTPRRLLQAAAGRVSRPEAAQAAASAPGDTGSILVAFAGPQLASYHPSPPPTLMTRMPACRRMGSPVPARAGRPRVRRPTPCVVAR
jgi:hypothetical protein